MAEFGENVRRLREAKGLTQQRLADQLYVTRQAVSRWEGGSRYPDLMTAKKLAETLGSTMDALLSQEDMRQYAQRAPVLESTVAKGAQTAALAFGFAGYLVRLLWFVMGLQDVSGWSGSPVGVVQVLKAALMAALFGYGALMSIRDRLTPKVAAAIAAVWFESAAMADALSMTLRVGNMVVFSRMQIPIECCVSSHQQICTSRQQGGLHDQQHRKEHLEVPVPRLVMEHLHAQHAAQSSEARRHQKQRLFRYTPLALTTELRLKSSI